MGYYVTFKRLYIYNFTYRKGDTIPGMEYSVEKRFVERGSTWWEGTLVIGAYIAQMIHISLSLSTLSAIGLYIFW